MAINIRCMRCKSDHKLGTTFCKKCDQPIGSHKKFKVAVKTPDGKRVVRLIDTLTLARRVESSIKGKVAEKKHLGITKAPLIDIAFEQYIDWAKDNKRTWNDDEIRWNLHIKPILSDKKMDAITPADVEAVLTALRKKKSPKGGKYKPATLKHVLGLIKGIYNWCAKRQIYIGTNPAQNISIPKFDNRKTEFLTIEQMDNLISVAENWPNKMAGLIVNFALYTGMRQSEITGLKWSHVDLKTGFASIVNSKGVVINTLPLSAIAQDVLNQAKGIAPDNMYCFPNRYGGRRTGFYKTWNRIRIATGIPKFRFHGLRHTFATYLASSGEVDLYTLQRLLTHKSPQMTQRYAHLLDEALRRGANVADKVFGNGQVSPSP